MGNGGTRWWIAAAAVLALAGPAAAQGRARASTCDGYPRAPVAAANGMCLGLVWSAARDGAGPRMPRTLLQLDGGDWLVSDLGEWTPDRGAVWRLSARPAATPAMRRVLGGLTMPHTLARGPDGRVYLGEMSRVVRFDPASANAAATVEPVLSGLPDNRLHQNRHPLSSFIFDGDGALLVNVGAPSDRCLDARARPLRGPDGRCVEAAVAAGVRRYAYLGGGRWSDAFSVFAAGLRNSLAMARHSSGTLWQAENSIDYPEPGRPFEELNRLVGGATYGWPYCFDMRDPAPGWAGSGCGEGYRAPERLLPPHAAPLHMLYYDGAMFPALRGRLLMSWHGHRPTGGRVVAYEVDAEGAPLANGDGAYDLWPRGTGRYPRGAPHAKPLVLTPGWGPQAGRRQGSPVGLAVAADGAVWIADDRNRQILRLAADRP